MNDIPWCEQCGESVQSVRMSEGELCSECTLDSLKAQAQEADSQKAQVTLIKEISNLTFAWS